MPPVKSGNVKRSSGDDKKPAFGLAVGDARALGFTQGHLGVFGSLPQQALLVAVAEAARVQDVRSLSEVVRYLSGFSASKRHSVDRAGDDVLVQKHHFQLFNQLKSGALKVRGHEASIGEVLLWPLLSCDEAVLKKRDVVEYAQDVTRLFRVAKVNESDPQFLRQAYGKCIGRGMELTKLVTPMFLEAGLGAAGVASEFLKTQRGSFSEEALCFVHGLLDDSPELSSSMATFLNRDLNGGDSPSVFAYFMSTMVQQNGWPKAGDLKAACIDAQAACGVFKDQLSTGIFLDPNSVDVSPVSLNFFFEAYAHVPMAVPRVVSGAIQLALERGQIGAEEWAAISPITRRLKAHGGLMVWPSLVDSASIGTEVILKELRASNDENERREMVSRLVRWLQYEPDGARWRPDLVVAALAQGLDPSASLGGRHGADSLKSEIGRLLERARRFGNKRGVSEIANAIEASEAHGQSQLVVDYASPALSVC